MSFKGCAKDSASIRFIFSHRQNRRLDKGRLKQLRHWSRQPCRSRRHTIFAEENDDCFDKKRLWKMGNK